MSIPSQLQEELLMTRGAKVGLVVAVLFSLLNLGGAVYAAVLGEVPHAGIHVALLLVGAYFVWWLAPSRYADRIRRRGGSENSASPRELADRMTQLEQSVDAVAIEVERIGEGQRFMTRLFTEHGAPRAPGASAAEPTESKAQKATPPVRRD
jgi:hypothetical protein